MQSSRRTFIKTGLGIVATGVALPSLLFSTSANVAESADAQSTDNSLNSGAIFGGSSFYGKVNHSTVTIDTENYYPQVADGNANTGWTPMEAKGPHWLEMRWRYPVKINGLSWKGKNISDANLQVPKNGQYLKVIDLRGENGHVEFAEITTDRLRIYITEFSGKPIVNELNVIGAEQPQVPAIFPGATVAGAKIIAANVHLSKSTFKPGDKIDLVFDVSSAAALQKDCYFIVEIREKAPNDYFRNAFGDFEVAGTVVAPGVAATQWKIGEIHQINAAIELPYYAPSGETAISIMAITNDGKQFVEVVNPAFGDNKLAAITIHRDDEKVNVEEFPLTQLSDKNGQRGFQRGSSFMMPFFNRFMVSSDFERFVDIKDNGLDIQYFLMYSGCIRPRAEWQDFLTRLDQQITNFLRVRPECYFMVGMDLRVSSGWLKENPNDRMIDKNGNVIIEKEKPYGLVSYGSQKYLQDCYDFIDLTIDFIKTKAYAGRVIGYYPYADSQNDAFIGGVANNRMIKDRNKILIGDFHPGVIQLFRNWLKKKYFSVGKLQAAWHDPSVTFENALPDSKNLVGEDVPSGVFRDPLKSAAAIDYITFFPTLIGGMYQKLAAHYKKRTDRKALVFMNYGAVLATLPIFQPSGAKAQTNNNDFHNLLEDENIDMFVQSMPYDERNADDPIVVYQPIESINVNKKMYMADYDARTISSGTLKYGRHRSQYESEAIIKRDLSWLMMKNSGAWLADMSGAGWRQWIENRKPWFSTPETTKPVRETIELFSKSAAVPKKSVCEIAVIVDIETPAYEDVLNSAVIYRGLITNLMRSEMVKLGAPYDLYLKADLTKGKIRDDYKLYIFINPFYLNNAERQSIEKLKGDGKTLAWFYAPGYLNESGMDVSNVSAVTGIDIHIKPNVKELLQMTVNNPAHPLGNNLQGTNFKTDMWDGVRDIHPDTIQPVFYVDDAKAQTLATYPDGKTAWGAKDFGDWKSVYSAVPFLNVQAIRNLAKYAGVHLYVDEDIVMGADNRFLMFTNGYKRKRSLNVNLPEIQTVKDAFSGEIISRGKQSFVLEMNTPETRILLVE